MFDYQQIFHVGHLVADIDRAMADIGDVTGLQWTRVQHVSNRSVWTPQRGAEEVALTFVYSRSGPQHIELLCGAPSSIWDPRTATGVHHVGVWSDSIPTDAERFIAGGWTLAAAARAPQDGFGAFAYVMAPTGMIVELVVSSARARFDEWFDGGSLGNDR